jgi:enamine deaminase RidA (YjgF/YER057c/UK114 family)
MSSSLPIVKAERTFTQSAWEKRWGYCRAIKVGSQVFVTGTVSVGDTPREQTLGAFKIIENALKQLGGSLENIVRTRMFVTNIEKDSEEIGLTHGEIFKNHPPATSMIGVKAFVDPKFVIEIEADAIIPSVSSKL